MKHEHLGEQLTGERVDVYWNLQRKCWSLRHRGIVKAYFQNLWLKDVRFIVSEPGRQRVIREKRKNVHAVARGTLLHPQDDLVKTGNRLCRLSYNPYKSNKFFIVGSEIIVEECDLCFFDLLGKANKVIS